ncbi:MAG: MbnP family protein [Chitinophagales bacterium]
MRKLILSFLISFVSLGVIAQNEVIIHFDHQLDANPLYFNTTSTASQGYDFNITRLEYYISEIEIVHDGGQITPVEDQWLLVNPANDNDFSLGSFDIENVEGLNYAIGVDQDHNHLDPTTFPMQHPLAPQSPSMHWGWSAGYRFIALEGKAGSNLIIPYEIHALGDINYNNISIAGEATKADNSLTINVLANYMNIFDNIDFSNGLIEHGESGYAANLCNRFATDVFTILPATNSTAIADNVVTQSFQVFPNPSTTKNIQVAFDLQNTANYNILVTDITGRIVQSENLSNTAKVAHLDLEDVGTYFVQLWENEKMIAMKKLLVLE